MNYKICTSPRSEDIEQIALIEKARFAEPWKLLFFYQDLLNNAPYTHYFFVKSNNVVLGYLIFHHLYEQIDLCKIATLKKQERQGVGSSLLNKLLEYGKENQVEVITLEVRVSNIKALEFYKKHGFKIKNK
jgi:ribosomal-protein-alanine N-acetyltransferase